MQFVRNGVLYEPEIKDGELSIKTADGKAITPANTTDYNTIKLGAMKALMSTPNLVVDGEFTSVWDDDIAITTNCKVNLHTKEVFDIEKADPDTVEKLSMLNEEYITVFGIDFPVEATEGTIPEGFWYEV